MRIAFFCMESTFSVRPLEALLAAGHDVRVVVRPIGGIESRKKPIFRRHPGFDVAVRRLLGLPEERDEERDPFAVAARAEIPAYLVGDASREPVVRMLKREKIDLLVVAFFNQLLHPRVFEAARLGGVNLHPSLLPRFRGPAPLFWIFREAVEETGLTIHRLAKGEDSGRVLAQTPMKIPFGSTGEDHVDELADVGARSLVDVVAQLERDPNAGVGQDDALATRAPRPVAADLLVDRSFSARRAYHFVRGVGRWNDVRVAVGDRHVRVVDSIEVDESRRLPGDTAIVGDVLHLGCDDGVVTFRAQLNV